MMRFSSKTAAVPTALLLLLLLLSMESVVAAVGNITEMTVLGDSLSDAGNLPDLIAGAPDFSNGPKAVDYIVSQLGLAPSTPSFHLSRGLPAAGNNYAYSTAVTFDGDGNFSTPDTNLPTQLQALLATSGGLLSPDELYYVWIGSNDVLNAGDPLEEAIGNGVEPPPFVEPTPSPVVTPSPFYSPSPVHNGKRLKAPKKGKKEDPPPKEPKKGKKGKKGGDDDDDDDHDDVEEPEPEYDWFQFPLYIKAREDVLRSANELWNSLLIMQAFGAKKMYVVGVPDLGLTPGVGLKVKKYLNTPNLTDFDYALTRALPQLHTELSELFNGAMRLRIRAGTLPGMGIQVEFLDMIPVLQSALVDAKAAGMNTEDPCIFFFSGGGAINPNCTVPAAPGFFWWDEVHITTVIHEIAGTIMADEIMAAFG